MERHVRTISIGSILAVVAAVAVLFLCDPAHVAIYPVCLFHRLTGLNCPGCGSLRAIHQLLHGNVFEALRFNALLVLSLPLFAWIGFRMLRQQIRRTEGPVVKPRWLWAYGAAWVLFGIIRELPVPLFSSLSP